MTTKIEVGLAISQDHILDTINRVNGLLNSLEASAPDEVEREKQHTVNVYALGVLFLKWVSENPDEDRLEMVARAQGLADRIQVR